MAQSAGVTGKCEKCSVAHADLFLMPSGALWCAKCSGSGSAEVPRNAMPSKVPVINRHEFVSVALNIVAVIDVMVFGISLLGTLARDPTVETTLYISFAGIFVWLGLRLLIQIHITLQEIALDKR